MCAVQGVSGEICHTFGSTVLTLNCIHITEISDIGSRTVMGMVGREVVKNEDCHTFIGY